MRPLVALDVRRASVPGGMEPTRVELVTSCMPCKRPLQLSYGPWDLDQGSLETASGGGVNQLRRRVLAQGSDNVGVSDGGMRCQCSAALAGGVIGEYNGWYRESAARFAVVHQLFDEDEHMLAAASAVNCNVLVLNRHYLAIRVINVRRAFSAALPAAGRSHPHRGRRIPLLRLRRAGATCRSSSGVRAERARLDQDGAVRHRRAADHPAEHLRQAAQAGREVQSAQHLRRVIRTAVSTAEEVPHNGTLARPRRSAKPGRRVNVGEHRLLLPEVQHPQGWTHAGRGSHEAQTRPRSRIATRSSA